MGSQKIDKPWGYEIIWASTPRYAGKILFIEKGHRLSRQYHQIKDESIVVLEGKLRLEIGPDQYDSALQVSHLEQGEARHITPGTVHRFCAEEGDVCLIEVSTPELHDVVRLEDDYKRIEKDQLPAIKPPRFQK
jgi:quercetin dioxygenase-like cupin family protein